MGTGNAWLDAMGVEHEAWAPYRHGGIEAIIERDAITAPSVVARIEAQHDGMAWVANVKPACDGTIERIADGVAWGYRIDGAMLRDRIMDRLTAWLGTMRDDERTARLIARCGWRIMVRDDRTIIEGSEARRCEHRTIEACQHARWARWIMREARRIAKRMPSGGGTMPSLDGDFERADGTGAWMDDDGDGAPMIGVPHPYGMPAPDVPERDAASLMPHAWWDAMSIENRERIGMILDGIERAPSSRIGRDRIAWDEVLDTLGDARHRSTVQREARGIIARAIARASMLDEAPDEAPSADDRIAPAPSRHEHREACGIEHARCVVQPYGTIHERAVAWRKALDAARRDGAAVSDGIIEAPYAGCQHASTAWCDEACRIERARAIEASSDRIEAWGAMI